MATAVKVLDKHRFESRARVLDVLSIGVLLVAGFALMVTLYRLGFTAGEAYRSGGEIVLTRDALFAVAIVEGALGTLALAWLSFRVFAVRTIGGRA